MSEPQGSCEVSWFSALCDDDYEYLGVPDDKLRSSWEHCRNIVLAAEDGVLVFSNGLSATFDNNILNLPVGTAARISVASSGGTRSSASTTRSGASG